MQAVIKYIETGGFSQLVFTTSVGAPVGHSLF